MTMEESIRYLRETLIPKQSSENQTMRQTAKRKGVLLEDDDKVPTTTYDELVEIVKRQKGVSPLSGVPIHYCVEKWCCGRPSADRIDNDLLHRTANLQITALAENHGRLQKTIPEFLFAMRYRTDVNRALLTALIDDDVSRLKTFFLDGRFSAMSEEIRDVLPSANAIVDVRVDSDEGVQVRTQAGRLDTVLRRTRVQKVAEALLRIQKRHDDVTTLLQLADSRSPSAIHFNRRYSMRITSDAEEMICEGRRLVEAGIGERATSSDIAASEEMMVRHCDFLSC